MNLNNSKEKVITNLLGDANQPKKQSTLIEEINLDVHPLPSASTSSQPTSQHNTPSSNEEPSLLELMMEAQKAAMKEKEKEKAVVQAKETKKSFSGFKKGFFGGKTNSKTEAERAPSSSSGKAKSEEILEVKASQHHSLKKTTAPVFDDVQTAMKEDANEKISSMLTQNKEWLTNDLMSQFQANGVLAKGFQNPKCVAAMQLLQSNPQEALERFKHDEEVSLFLKEFGRVMGDHFMSLAEQKQQKEEEQKPASSVIQEIGPLQAQALKNAKKEPPRTEGVEKRPGTEDEQVKKVSDE